MARLWFNVKMFLGIVWRESPAGGRISLSQAWDMAFNFPPRPAWLEELRVRMNREEAGNG